MHVVKQNNLQRHLIAMQQPSTQARRLFQHIVYGSQHILGQMAEATDYDNLNVDLLKEY